jgi:Mg-chelatase subunit ChlD
LLTLQAMKRLHQLLLFCIIGFCAQAQNISFVAPKQNIGVNINDSLQQLQPILWDNGKQLAFQQMNGKGKRENMNSLLDANGIWQKKEKYKSLPVKIIYHEKERTAKNGGLVFLANSTLKYEEVVIPNIKWPKGMVSDLTVNASKTVLIFVFNNGRQKDLYISQRKQIAVDSFGKWSEAQLLNQNINTETDEETPFLTEDNGNQLLFFSSKRKGGFGGHDVYVSVCPQKDYADWASPVNLGEKVNGNANETFFKIYWTYGKAFLCSDQQGFGRNDIYELGIGDSIPKTPPNETTDYDTKDTSRTFVDSTHKQSHIVFLLDVSNSMSKDKKFQLLKKTMLQLVKKLRISDKVSLVTFGDQAYIYLEGEPVKNKSKIVEMINDLATMAAATNIDDGLTDAYTLGNKFLIPTGNNQIFLVTDGVFKLNADSEKLLTSNPKLLLTIVMLGNAQGVQQFLQPLAEKTKGQFVKIADEEQDVNRLLDNVLRNARKKK